MQLASSQPAFADAGGANHHHSQPQRSRGRAPSSPGAPKHTQSLLFGGLAAATCRACAPHSARPCSMHSSAGAGVGGDQLLRWSGELMQDIMHTQRTQVLRGRPGVSGSGGRKPPAAAAVITVPLRIQQDSQRVS
jgi:hypothetical protein